MDALNNPARLEKTQEITCDNCEEMFAFGMRDNFHEFSIGLTTVLTCLLIAEQEGQVPPLPDGPDGWWMTIARRYPNFYKQYNAIKQQE